MILSDAYVEVIRSNTLQYGFRQIFFFRRAFDLNCMVLDHWVLQERFRHASNHWVGIFAWNQNNQLSCDFSMRWPTRDVMNLLDEGIVEEAERRGVVILPEHWGALPW